MVRRTTIAADDEVLVSLQVEAKRRGISFAMFAAEILAEKAAELRKLRRPRIGIGHSGSGAAQESVDREDLPAAQ